MNLETRNFGRPVITALCLFWILCIVVPVPLFAASDEEPWWNDQWQYRRKITLDTSAAGADVSEAVTDAAVLLRLHSGNFDFTHAKDRGEDLRILSADGTTPLKYHIEKFDALEEMAFVWVRVPRLKASDRNSIWVYYGNPDASPGEDVPGTFDTNQIAVYHFQETEGVPQDATAYGNHAREFAGWQGFPAVIGNGISLNGVSDKMVLPRSTTLDFSKGITFSAWIRMENAVQDGYIFSWGDEEAQFVIGVDQTQLYARLVPATESDASGAEVNAEIELGAWHLLTVTAMPNQRLSLYVDGQEAGSSDLSNGLPSVAVEAVLGASDREGHYFFGALDEVRISNVARSPAWIRTAYLSEGPEGALASFNVEEIHKAGFSLPVFYLATVAKNITFDGWLIIGILIILSIWSWVVFVSKAIFLRLMERENTEFKSAFVAMQDLVALDSKGEDFENSPLFYVYTVGCATLRRILQSLDPDAANSNPGPENPGPRSVGAAQAGRRSTVSSKAMNTFKAALERGFIEESRKMNAQLVVMTMAVTGGPFLGLLGTVWGVMNTFAAMAEAGEANIMAIAPGVASALSTTVFGLIVAIPALFGYNYLNGKIKSLTAEMHVFILQFANRVDEVHGGN